jgi:hypothetical protein
MFARQRWPKSKRQILEFVPVFSMGAPYHKFVYPGVLSNPYRASALATGCSVEISGMQPPMHDLRQNKALGLCPIFQFLFPITDGCSCSFWGYVEVAETFARIHRSKTGPVDYEWGISSASTDFVRCLPKMISLPTEAFSLKGNITYGMLLLYNCMCFHYSESCSVAIYPSWVLYVSLSSTRNKLMYRSHLVAIPTESNGGNHTPAFASASATPAAHQACLEVCKALALTGIRVIKDDRFYAEVNNQWTVGSRTKLAYFR